MSLTAAQYAKKAYDKLVAEGRTVTITSYSNSYNPATGETTQTTTPHTVVASPLLEYSRQSFGGSEYSDQTLIQVGDMYLIVPNYGLSFTPDIGQLVTVDTVAWRVIRVRTHSHKIGVVVYELQVRRA